MYITHQCFRSRSYVFGVHFVFIIWLCGFTLQGRGEITVKDRNMDDHAKPTVFSTGCANEQLIFSETCLCLIISTSNHSSSPTILYWKWFSRLLYFLSVLTIVVQVHMVFTWSITTTSNLIILKSSLYISTRGNLSTHTISLVKWIRLHHSIPRLLF